MINSFDVNNYVTLLEILLEYNWTKDKKTKKCMSLIIKEEYFGDDKFLAVRRFKYNSKGIRIDTIQ